MAATLIDLDAPADAARNAPATMADDWHASIGHVPLSRVVVTRGEPAGTCGCRT